MAISDRLNKLTTDITNAYTSIENKGGTIPANKNTNNLSTAIDSIEVIEQQSAEGESLSLTNTKAMPYKDYVVEGKSEQDGIPSPSNPSEIHSVADDVNLINVEDSTATATKQFDITNNVELGQNYSVSALLDLTNSPSGTQSRIRIDQYVNGAWAYNSSLNIINSGTSGKSIIENFVINENATQVKLTIQNYAGGNLNCDYSQIKLQKGTIATPYSPYNQGTVTIKQRGKNLFDINNVQKGVYYDNNGQHSLSVSFAQKLIVESGETYTYLINNKYSSSIRHYIFAYDKDMNYITNFIWGSSISANSTYKRLCIMPSNVKYLTISVLDINPNEVDITEVIEIQLEKGNNHDNIQFKPYQGYDKVFQTSPLRSLPNGVKDTIEEDGIHRRVGRVVLDGTENWTQNSTYQNVYLIDNFLTDANTTETRPMLSDYFQYGGLITQGSSTVEIGKFYQWTSLPQRLILGYNSTSLNDFKVWLSNNLVTILYPLATEVIEPLTQNQATTMLDIIKTGSYEGTTNIYTDEDLKPTMKVGYYKKA